VVAGANSCNGILGLSSKLIDFTLRIAPATAMAAGWRCPRQLK